MKQSSPCSNASAPDPQSMPHTPEEFIFDNTQLVNLPKMGAGLLPCPEEVTQSKNLFIIYAWDVFYNIGMMIRKKLQGRYPRSFRRSEALFSFSFVSNEKIPGAFILEVEQIWAVEILGFPQKIKVSNQENCPWKALADIMMKVYK